MHVKMHENLFEYEFLILFFLRNAYMNA